MERHVVTLRIPIETLERVGEPRPAAVLYAALMASFTAPPIVGQDAARLSAVLEHLGQTLGPETLRRCQEEGARLGDNGTAAFALAPPAVPA